MSNTARQVVVVNDHNRIEKYPAAASQTIKVGQLVALDADGLVVKATAISAKLLGVCAADVTATAAGDAVYVQDDPRAKFLIEATVPADLDQDQVGGDFDLSVTGDVHTLNVGASAVDVLRLLALPATFNPLADGVSYEGSTLVGDFLPGWRSDGRVLVEIASHALQS